MSTQTKLPWASGPAEILRHGIGLLRKDSDANRRLAMLSIDNAVELTIKTYLGLPKRVTGLRLSRAAYQEIFESFPKLLDALEQNAADKIGGIDLGEIEWYHRLRNELYHQGNGLTVERAKVEVYADLAKLLFKNLFGLELEVPDVTTSDVLGQFLAKWALLERAATQCANKRKGVPESLSKPVLSPLTTIRELTHSGILNPQDSKELDELRQIRNQVVHGMADYKEALTDDHLRRLTQIYDKVKQTLGQHDLATHGVPDSAPQLTVAPASVIPAKH